MAGTVYERRNVQLQSMELAKKKVDFRLKQLKRAVGNEYLVKRTKQHMQDKIDLLINISVTIKSIIIAIKLDEFIDGDLLPGLSRALDMMEQEGAADG